MKNKYKVIITLSLALIMIVTVASPVLAAKPTKSWVTITNLQEDTITFEYGWNKVSAWYYRIIVYESGTPGQILDSGLVDLGGRTPSTPSTPVQPITYNDTAIDTGETYYVILYLYGKNGRPKDKVQAYDFKLCPFPSS